MELSEEIIRKAQQGDANAFSDVLDSSYELIFSVAMKYVMNRQDAEDVTQQVCIKLARSIAQYRFDSSFSTWLYRVVVNCANDWHRKEGRHHQSDNDVAQNPVSHNSDVAEQQLYLKQVLEQINTWGKGYLDAVVLVIGEGLTHQAAARVLDVTESTVSWRIHEVRKRLHLLESGGQKA
ncbi:RNA polymerase sigma factor [Solemya velum gill symbiont]|uniref:RNA polymerase sigma factor n=1 Tax=Solemya velum gill symbiont TaxID=2340 RepID=A0A0B0H4A1_SOVGS|nr:RNA polymerase sigma factor [Solemya velum gill symbiont]KHF25038.1 RNA polymerase sigma factor [Solemya velum gill symbiont]